MVLKQNKNIKVTTFNHGAAVFDCLSGGTHFLPWPYSQLLNLFKKESVVSQSDIVEYVINVCNAENLSMSEESLNEFISQVVDLDILINEQL